MMARFWVAEDMSIPEVSKVSVFVAAVPTVTNPPGLRILMPPHVKLPPSAAELAAVTVLFQTAMSAELGKTSQLPARFSAVVLFCLIRSAAPTLEEITAIVAIVARRNTRKGLALGFIIF